MTVCIGVLSDFLASFVELFRNRFPDAVLISEEFNQVVYEIGESEELYQFLDVTVECGLARSYLKLPMEWRYNK